MTKKIEAAVSHEGRILLFVEGGEVFEMEFVRGSVIPSYRVRKLDDLPEAVTRRGY